MKILFTGFEPFDGGTSNPSYACLRELPPTIGTAELVTMELPVSFRRAPELLLKGMDAEGPMRSSVWAWQPTGRKFPWRRWDSITPMPRVPDNDGMHPGTSSRPSGLPPAFPPCRFGIWPQN